jgi:hypothetical protein
VNRGLNRRDFGPFQTDSKDLIAVLLLRLLAIETFCHVRADPALKELRLLAMIKEEKPT